jgi:IPT/TIG domain/PASTA domain
MRSGARIAIFISVLAACGAIAASAAAQTTIGELMPASDPGGVCTAGGFDIVPASPVGPYTAPTPGVITSWSTRAGAGKGQQLAFKVFRPSGTGMAGPRFTVVGHDGPRMLTPESVNTFATAIRVQAGDLIGDSDENAETVHNSCKFRTALTSDLNHEVFGDAADGKTIESGGGESKYRVNVTATVLAPPTISLVSPATGPAAAVTPITITGAEFARVQSVTVGSTAVSFATPTENDITTAIPAGTAGASVPVTVTTLAGRATSTFTYAAAPPVTTSPPPALGPPAPTCVVPNLHGKKLKATKKVLGRVDCKVGRVGKKKGVTARSGKVVKQRPKPGTIRPPGSKVFVRLG